MSPIDIAQRAEQGIPRPAPVAEAIRSVGHAVDNLAVKAEHTATAAADMGVRSTKVRTFMQLGFAGLVGLLFWNRSNDTEKLVSTLITDLGTRATANEKMYREESAEQRKMYWQSVQMTREGLDGVKHAVEVNTAAVSRVGYEQAKASTDAASAVKQVATELKKANDGNGKP